MFEIKVLKRPPDATRNAMQRHVALRFHVVLGDHIIAMISQAVITYCITQVSASAHAQMIAIRIRGVGNGATLGCVHLSV